MKKIFLPAVCIIIFFLSCADSNIIIFKGEFSGTHGGSPANLSKAEISSVELFRKNSSLKITLPPAEWADYRFYFKDIQDLSVLRQNTVLEFMVKIPEGMNPDIQIGLIQSDEKQTPYHTDLTLADYCAVGTGKWEKVRMPLKDFPAKGYFWDNKINDRVDGDFDFSRAAGIVLSVLPSFVDNDIVFYTADIRIKTGSRSTKIKNKYAEHEKKYAYEGSFIEPVREKTGKFKWPKKYTCAVTLTFDDGLKTHITNAFPLLEKYGLTGTFFLTGYDWYKRENIERWKKVHGAGNEIGAHTTHHPLSLIHISEPTRPY